MRPALLISVIILCCNLSAKAQLFKKKKENKKAELVELNSDSVTIEITDIVFTNINKVGLYTNDKQLKRIEKLDKEGDWKALYPELLDYVSKFGIREFCVPNLLLVAFG